MLAHAAVSHSDWFNAPWQGSPGASLGWPGPGDATGRLCCMPWLLPPARVPTNWGSSELWVGNLHRGGSQENAGSSWSWLAGIQV